MEFDKNTKTYATQVERQGGEDILYINYKGASEFPSLADSGEVMGRTIDALIENPNVSRIVFVQNKNYNYDLQETNLLLEIAHLYVYFLRQEKILSMNKLVSNSNCQRFFNKRYNDLFSFLFFLKKDPLIAYFDLKKFIFEGKIFLNKISQNCKPDQENYLRVLEEIKEKLESTALISKLRPYLDDYSKGDREIYQNLFKPDVIPNFTFTRIVEEVPSPKDAELVDEYNIFSDENDVSRVSIFRKKNEAKLVYHLEPPENSLDEEKSELLNMARGVLIEHQPKAEEFTDTERTRQVFFNIAKDLLQDLASARNLKLSYQDLNLLSKILVRHTIGFGLIEILLQDDNLQDIVLNAPIPRTNIFVRHGNYDECSTNILPSQEDADSWAAKFRMLSGRPLDEANPILDTQVTIGNLRARVATIQNPLSPDGIAYAFRRHRENPWTLPLFIKYKMLNPLAAGLLSFIVDGSRTMLVAGTRSSGKCVEGNTLIQFSDGKIEKIKNLLGKHKKTISDGNVFYPSQDTRVFSLNDKECKIEEKRIMNVWKRRAPAKLLKIKTASGKEIITTFEHPYFVGGSEIKNKRADVLKKGELIATPRKLSVSSSPQKINLKNTGLKENICKETKDYFFLKGKTNSCVIKFPKKITPRLAEFVGMVLGDGHLDLNKLGFYNCCEQLRERYIDLLKNFNVNYTVFNSSNTTVVQASSRILNNALKEVFEIPFGKKANKIKIPQKILQSDNYVLSRFLRGYFDCEGYIPLEKRDIEIVTASKEMSEHLRLALLRFGIVVFSKEKKIKGVEYYRNLIRGEFVNNYIKNIGFYHPNKRKRAKRLSQCIFLNNSNIDTIPYGNDILKDLRNLLRISLKNYKTSGKDYWSHENMKYRTTRNSLEKIIKFYSQKYKSLKSMEKEANNLKEFVGFDFRDFIMKVLKIKNFLGISLSEISSATGLSARSVDKILNQKNQPSFSTFVKMNKLQPVFSEHLKKLKDILSLNFNIKNLSLLVNKGVVSYSEISKRTKIPETSIKSYAYLDIMPPKKRQKIIENCLTKLKNDLKRNYLLAKKEYEEISFKKFSLTSLMLSLKKLRKELNIQNKELASKVSLSSISYLFNQESNPEIKNLESICKNVLDIYERGVSKKVLKKISFAENLFNSDIFWDKIKSIEKIKSKDNYVYDLSVENNPSFVANGIIAHNTSLLGSLMQEIIPRYRVIVVEDSLELPVESLRKLKYDILSMKVRSSLLKTTTEVSAEEGIRTSLRLGDSCLIVGEVRSTEATALYEAMRVGALANVVAGTIHGASPYGVFDRVVNDLGVQATSFKATDIIIVANVIKSPDGLESYRRIVQITEVRKHWNTDPISEGGFVDLMKYDVEEDELKPTEDLINGESEILKGIAGNVKGWAGNWDAVWDNILLRAEIKKEITELSEKENLPELLEANFNVLSNDAFHKISESVRRKSSESLPLKKYVFPEWKKWLENQVQEMKKLK